MFKLRPTLPCFAVLVFLAGCDGSPSSIQDEPALAAHDAVAHAAHMESALARAAPAMDNRDLALMRQATARYQRVEAALADGFVPVSPCVAEEHLGAMGIHYGHPRRMEDDVVDPAMPELLLYEPEGDGRMRLVGVEFWVEQEAWYAAGHAARPSLAGQPFDFAPAGEPPMSPDKYTLHVWVWRDNPLGMFAPFNPKVSCS